MAKRTLKEQAEDARRVESLMATIKTLQADKRRLNKRIGNWDRLVDAFTARVPTLPTPKRIRLTARPSKGTQEVVALLSDTHATEFWTRSQTDGHTEYNFEIFCEHLHYYGQEIVRVTQEDRGKFGLKHLHVDMLGDIFQGVLRVEDEVTNEFPTVLGLIHTGWVLWQWLVALSEHFDTVTVTGMAGNHGRLHQKPQAKRYTAENRDTLLYLTLQKYAAVAGLTDRIKVRVPGSRVHTLSRLGHRIKLGHGDHVRGGNSIAGLPIYGLSREMLRQFRKELHDDRRRGGIALIEYGHWHQYSFLENMLIINGALCPTDPYAFDQLGALADPTQLVYYTSRKHAIGWRCPFSLKWGAGQSHPFQYDREALT